MFDEVLTTLSKWRLEIWTREALPLFTCHAMSDKFVFKLNETTLEAYNRVGGVSCVMSDEVLTKLTKLDESRRLEDSRT